MNNYHGWREAQRKYPLTGQRCVRCSAPARVRHHRDGDPSNNAQENVELLCRACHMRHHDSLAEYRALGREVSRLAKLSRTHCRKGHEWTPENTYIRADGARVCRACRRTYPSR